MWRQLKILLIWDVLSNSFLFHIWILLFPTRQKQTRWRSEKQYEKKMHITWVSISRPKVLGDTIFKSPTVDGTAIFNTWSSEAGEVLAICKAKEVPSFLSYFETVSICPGPGIDLATPRSAVKCSTDRANHDECRFPLIKPLTLKVTNHFHFLWKIL